MRRTSLLGALLLAGAVTPLATATTASASADDCSSIFDYVGYVSLSTDNTGSWFIGDEGEIEDGAVGQRDDAYDSFPYFSIDDGTNGREYYDNPDSLCSFEAGGRQLAFPSYTTTAGLQLSRKVWVPSGGDEGFARFYNQVTNPGATPVTITVYSDGNLGSDGSTTLRDSSTGAAPAVAAGIITQPVSWFSTSDDAPDTDGDPVLTHTIDAGAGVAGVRDRVDVVTASSDDIQYEYKNVTIPAGGTVSYVNFEAMRTSVAAASAAGRSYDTQTAVQLAGLTDAELASVMNWNGTDIDRDGVGNSSDNCRSVANANQADLDKDGIGDACDTDIDGDGIANDVETAFGTNPAKADTDGDGVRDSADNCPKVAGKSADGCQVPVVVVNNVRSASATKVKGTMNKTGKVVVKARGSVSSTGTVGARDCLNGKVWVVVKVGKLAVADKIVKLSDSCTFRYKVRLSQPRAIVKKVSVKASFLGSDGLLPSAKRDKI